MSVVQEQAAIPVFFFESAVHRVQELVEDEGNPALKLRVFVTGGGCSGFQYGFTFDERTRLRMTLRLSAMALLFWWIR